MIKWIEARDQAMTCQVAKERAEERLKSEGGFLRSQLLGEQQGREALELQVQFHRAANCWILILLSWIPDPLLSWKLLFAHFAISVVWRIGSTQGSAEWCLKREGGFEGWQGAREGEKEKHWKRAQTGDLYEEDLFWPSMILKIHAVFLAVFFARTSLGLKKTLKIPSFL